MNLKVFGTLTAMMFGLAATPASADVKIGTLSCDVEPGYGFVIGSHKEMSCTFYGMDGTQVDYVGSIGKLGIDIGFTSATHILWAVIAPGAGSADSLSGSYTGANVEGTVGFGVGANVLVGGMHKSINLQPVSVQGQAGLNVAAAVSSIKLTAVR